MRRFRGFLVGQNAGFAQISGPALKHRTDINPALLYWQAFSVFPELNESEESLLYRDVSSLKPTEAEGEVSRRFDRTFKLIIRAARMEVPCDWGVDLADGPETVLLNLVKIRNANYAVVLRVRVALTEGRQSDACDEILAMLKMGRWAALDGSLVQVMIQSAVESKLIELVARHLDVLDMTSLSRLMAGLRGEPARVTTGEAMAYEQKAFHGWMVAKLEAIREGSAGDETRSFAQGMEFLNQLFRLEPDVADWVTAKAGGSGLGLVAAARKSGGIYEIMKRVTEAGPGELEARRVLCEQALESDPLASLFVPNIGKARLHELKLTAHLSMLEAAIAFKGGRKSALEDVVDSFGTGSFTKRPGVLPDGTRGFELVTAWRASDFETALFFVFSSAAERAE